MYPLGVYWGKGSFLAVGEVWRKGLRYGLLRIRQAEHTRRHVEKLLVDLFIGPAGSLSQSSGWAVYGSERVAKMVHACL